MSMAGRDPYGQLRVLPNVSKVVCTVVQQPTSPGMLLVLLHHSCPLTPTSTCII